MTVPHRSHFLDIGSWMRTAVPTAIGESSRAWPSYLSLTLAASSSWATSCVSMMSCHFSANLECFANMMGCAGRVDLVGCPNTISAGDRPLLIGCSAISIGLTGNLRHQSCRCSLSWRSASLLLLRLTPRGHQTAGNAVLKIGVAPFIFVGIVSFPWMQTDVRRRISVWSVPPYRRSTVLRTS